MDTIGSPEIWLENRIKLQALCGGSFTLNHKKCNAIRGGNKSFSTYWPLTSRAFSGWALFENSDFPYSFTFIFGFRIYSDMVARSSAVPRCLKWHVYMLHKLAYILSFIYYFYLSSHSRIEISAIANFQWKKPVGGGKAGSDWSFSYSLPSYSDIWMSLMSKSYPDIRILRYSLKALVPMRTVKLKTSVFQYS